MANKEIFDRLAMQYDTPDRIKLAQIITAEIKKYLGDTSEKTLIDYGSGTGLVSLPLSSSFRDVFLMDASPAMMEAAEQKIQAAEVTNVHTVIADFLKDQNDIKGDIILVSLVLLHIPETEKILRELFQHLNPGGTLMIADFDKNKKIDHPKVHNGFEQDELQKLLLKTGFSESESHTFYHGEKLFMREDASLFLSIGIK
ncbi:methyltransferase domain protein [Enterococcus faecalis 13-SD-W-01]|nr:methyltransferase domain protein [Enterococcus faecalis 13-SD-W-01]